MMAIELQEAAPRDPEWEELAPKSVYIPNEPAIVEHLKTIYLLEEAQIAQVTEFARQLPKGQIEADENRKDAPENVG